MLRQSKQSKVNQEAETSEKETTPARAGESQPTSFHDTERARIIDTVKGWAREGGALLPSPPLRFLPFLQSSYLPASSSLVLPHSAFVLQAVCLYG